MKMNQWFRALLTASVFGFALTACSTTQSTETHYVYTDNWWYDDYFYYQDHVYPNCCNDHDDFEEAVKAWWHTLDPEKQDEIKDKIDSWQQGNGPDIDALKKDFAEKWQSLPPEKQDEISAKRQEIQDMMQGKELSETQKQAVKEKWQSAERPSLQRGSLQQGRGGFSGGARFEASGQLGGRVSGGRIGGARR